jgi:hypothetical protein
MLGTRGEAPIIAVPPRWAQGLRNFKNGSSATDYHFDRVRRRAISVITPIPIK